MVWKKLPIGISDFKKVIKGNYYYFNKTELISSVVKEAEEVQLFTWPWKFGKTLNMSMIKYFFDIRNKDEINLKIEIERIIYSSKSDNIFDFVVELQKKLELKNILKNLKTKFGKNIEIWYNGDKEIKKIMEGKN